VGLAQKNERTSSESNGDRYSVRELVVNSVRVWKGNVTAWISRLQRRREGHLPKLNPNPTCVRPPLPAPRMSKQASQQPSKKKRSSLQSKPAPAAPEPPLEDKHEAPIEESEQEVRRAAPCTPSAGSCVHPRLPAMGSGCVLDRSQPQEEEEEAGQRCLFRRCRITQPL
jgi:hypothetical protein